MTFRRDGEVGLMRRWRWVVGGLVVVAASGLAGVAAGVELTHRWPFETFEVAISRYRIALRPIAPWSFRKRVPLQRYEGLGAVADGRLLIFGGFHNPELNASRRVDRYDPATDSWERLGDMPAAITHANPAMRDGEIWIAGGFVGDHPAPASDQVWRYDPRADRWTPGTPLPAARGGGSLVALENGTLHYFGGWLPDRATDSPDHWKLARGDSVWRSVAPFPVPRGHHSAVVVGGYVYAIGGCVGHDPTPIDVEVVHRYDPSTDTWTEVAPLPVPRSHAESSTFAHEGRIYVVAGRSIPTGRPGTREVLVYDPPANTWSFVASLPRGLLAPVAGVIGNELLVSSGGDNSYSIFNLQTWAMPVGSEWRPVPDMPVALGEVAGGIIGRRLYVVGDASDATLVLDLGTGVWLREDAATRRPVPGHHHAAEVVNGELYLIGGFTPRSLDAVQVYNPVADRWRVAARLPFPVGSAATAVIDGRIYIAGGVVGDTTTRQALVFDPRSGASRAIAPMPRARNHAAAATDGLRLFVFGGRGPGSGDANELANGFDDVQIYDPSTDTWVASGSEAGAPARLPQARGGTGKAVFAAGEFYVIGGETLDGPGASKQGVYDRVDIYDPVANAWRSGPPLRVPRHGIFPVRYGPGIWVAGGGERAGWAVSSAVEMLLIPLRN